MFGFGFDRFKQRDAIHIGHIDVTDHQINPL